MITSHFSCLEFESVAARALKGRLLDLTSYNALLGAFAADIDANIWLTSFDDERMNEAIEVARRHGLRAADSMQVAASIHANRLLTGGQFLVVASDKQLLLAAKTAGIAVLDPEAENAQGELRALREREARK